MLNWLLGPRSQPPQFAPLPGAASSVTRNLDLDLETLQDIVKEVAQFAYAAGGLTTAGDETVNYDVRGRQVPDNELGELSVADMNELVLTYNYITDRNSLNIGQLSFSIAPSTATVTVYGIGLFGNDRIAQTHDMIIAKLYAEGSQRPWWRGTVWMLPLLPAVAALTFWILAIGDLPLPANATMGALLVLAGAGATAWALQLKRTATERPNRTMRFRSESRAQTKQRRADDRANLKLFVITAPTSAALGVVGTLAVQWLNRS